MSSVSPVSPEHASKKTAEIEKKMESLLELNPDILIDSRIITYIRNEDIRGMRGIQSMSDITDDQIELVLSNSGLILPTMSTDPLAMTAFISNITILLQFYSHFTPFPEKFVSYVQINNPFEKMKNLLQKYNKTIQFMKDSMVQIKKVILFSIGLIEMARKQKENDEKKAVENAKKEENQKKNKTAPASLPVAPPPEAKNQSDPNSTEKKSSFYNAFKRVIEKAVHHGKKGTSYIFGGMETMFHLISKSTKVAILYHQIQTHMANLKKSVQSILFFRSLHYQIKEEIKRMRGDLEKGNGEQNKRNNKKKKEKEEMGKKLGEIAFILDSMKFGEVYHEIKTYDIENLDTKENKKTQQRMKHILGNQ
jgi:hypothetical protein